jgi:hypothetical protein
LCMQNVTAWPLLCLRDSVMTTTRIQHVSTDASDSEPEPQLRQRWAT